MANKEDQVTEESVKKDVKAALEQSETKVEEDNESSPIEATAKEKGWVPKEEFKGDPETWVEAKEFVAREPLYKALHQANRKIKKMEDTLDRFKEHYTKVEVAAKEKAIKELQAQLEVASEERDIKAALQIKDKIDTIQKETKEEVKENTEFNTWVEDNTWYNEDNTLKTAATGIGFGLQQEHPEWPVGKIYKEVTKIIKESFPDKFEEKRPTTKVGSTTKTTGSGDGKRTLSYRQLPEEARQNYNRLVKSGKNPTGILTPEEFFKDYIAVGGTLVSGD